MIYAIADLHGRFDLLKEAINAIEKHSANDADTKIITLGDYIDRGPESKQIIDYLIKHDHIIALQGNHEDMAVQVMSNPNWSMVDWWRGNGGVATWKSYGSANIEAMDTDHIKWMANLPLYHETEKQVFVHAGIPFDGVPLAQQDRERMMWMLYSSEDSGGWNGKHVVHGHHQFEDGPHEWAGRTDLDTFAWYTGRLVVGVFNDTQGKAVEYLEILV